MLEEIFIMCFYGIIYLKIEGGEKEKKFFLYQTLFTYLFYQEVNDKNVYVL